MNIIPWMTWTVFWEFCANENAESVLVLIKPDGMQKAIAGEVISLFLASDLKLTGMKLVQVSSKLAQAHYGHLQGQFFFKEIVSYLMGDLHGKNPVVAMVFTGKDAVAKCRAHRRRHQSRRSRSQVRAR